MVSFQTRSWNRDLAVSGLYEFSANDPGTFTFDPVSEFQIIGPNDAIRVEVADFRSVFVPVPITDVSKRELKPEKGQVVKCADSENGWAIVWSVIGARFMANAAALYINKTGGDDELYSDYFGPDDSTRAAVIENFMKIANSNNDSMILSCPDSPNNCDLEKNSVYHENKDIFFCDSFYNELPFESLCTNDPAIPERGVRSVTTLFYLLKALIPGSYSRGGLCLGEPSEPISENIDNYIVSSQTPLHIPRARGLIWGHDLCSVSLWIS